MTDPVIVKLWRAGELFSHGDVVESRTSSAFQFRAVQTNPGRSGATEPVWPTVLGGTVVDNEVTWQALAVDTQTWRADAIGKTGVTEPIWPTQTFEQTGTLVIDGDARWKAIAPVVTDRLVPNSKSAIMIGSKVMSGDGDVVRFSATNNGLDWSSTGDAGFLPTGTQSVGEVNVTALAQYRGNLVVFTPSTAQIWQVDPDPQRMTLLDIIEGVGTPFTHGFISVASDLLFLTPLGVRSLSVTGGSHNLQTGDVGTVVDSLVKPLAAATTDPMMLFYPASGQVWVAFGAEVFVLTSSPAAGVQAWSRYILPGVLDAWAILSGELYLRIGNNVYRVDESATTDNGATIPVTVQWPWLDFGDAAQTKQLFGLDYTGKRAVSLSVGYDQSNASAFTQPVTLGPDTTPGQIVPISVTAPSFSIKIEHAANEDWEMQALTVYLNDMRPTS